MTQGQTEQFKKFGCISRSLIILAALKLKPFASWEAYCQEFGHLFPNPENQYGGLFPSQIVEVARTLGFGSYSECFRRYEEIHDWHNKGNPIFVVSEIDLSPGQTGINRHCSVLEKIDTKEFSLIVPSQDGKDYILRLIAADWDTKLCHGLVLR